MGARLLSSLALEQALVVLGRLLEVEEGLRLRLFVGASYKQRVFLRVFGPR